MLGWRCHVLYCVPDVHTGTYSLLLDEIVHRWMIIVGCLPHDFDIKYHTRAYSPIIGEILFAQWYKDGWLVLVIYLMTLTSDLIQEHIFPIFFEYPWDWDNDQLCFRLCTSLWLLTIDCIKTSLHGFVEIEMDHIRFQPRNMGGSFSQMLMR